MKLNRQRNLALGLIFGAFLVMYLGLFVDALMPYTFTLGCGMILWSVFIYFRVGAMSMKIPTITCPKCHKQTKVMGTEDACAYCHSTIFLELDEDGELYAIIPK